MTDRELFKMALDALEKGAWDTLIGRNAAEALRARLAEDEITPEGWYRVDAWIKEKNNGH